MLQVFLSKTGITTGKSCRFSSSVWKAENARIRRLQGRAPLPQEWPQSSWGADQRAGVPEREPAAGRSPAQLSFPPREAPRRSGSVSPEAGAAGAYGAGGAARSQARGAGEAAALAEGDRGAAALLRSAALFEKVLKPPRTPEVKKQLR